MDYRKIYNALIQKRKEKRLSRKECYCEKHHIIPRSIGGTDEEVNLVLLTAREHLLAHKILVRILAFEKGIDSKEYEKMVYALWYMSHKGKKSGIAITSRVYDKLKDEIARANGEYHSGERHWNYGRHWSNEVREKIRRAHKGKKWTEERKSRPKKYGADASNYGHRWTEEMKKKASERRKGIPLSEKARKALIDYHRTHENPMKGKNVRDYMTEESYKRMLEKRSKTMKKTMARIGYRNPFEGKSKGELEVIKQHRVKAQIERWSKMTPEEYKEEKDKKRYACAIGHLKKQLMLLMFYLVISKVI